MTKIAEIKEFGHKNKVPIIIDETLQFLFENINNTNSKKILEIGTAIGYSSIAIAQNCEIDEIITLEIDEKRYKIACDNIKKSNLMNKIFPKNCDAGKWIENCKEKFDFIFLDGSKGQYLKYLPYLLAILKTNGIIFADNVLFKGMVVGDIPTPKSCKTMIKNLQLYLEEVSNKTYLKSSLYSIGDGVCITKKLN